jgi:hypothetical protein
MAEQAALLTHLLEQNTQLTQTSKDLAERIAGSILAYVRPTFGARGCHGSAQWRRTGDPRKRRPRHMGSNW